MFFPFANGRSRFHHDLYHLISIGSLLIAAALALLTTSS
jgi:hypothetical protein